MSVSQYITILKFKSNNPHHYSNEQMNWEQHWPSQHISLLYASNNSLFKINNLIRI